MTSLSPQIKQLHRYYDTAGTNGPYIYLQNFNVISETDKTYLIDVYGVRKRVLKNANKRFAYPTLEEAWDSYGKRKSWQRRHAMNTLAHAEACLELHKQGFANLDMQHNHIFEF